MGLTCGNPTAMPHLKEGETIVDLGRRRIRCFLAAAKVGATGRAIGIEMTPEMIELNQLAVDVSHFGFSQR